MLLHPNILKRNDAILGKAPFRNPSAIRQPKRNRRLKPRTIYARLPSANYHELHNCSNLLPLLGSCRRQLETLCVSVPLC